jgi:hypothetical protein
LPNFEKSIQTSKYRFPNKIGDFKNILIST